MSAIVIGVTLSWLALSHQGPLPDDDTNEGDEAAVSLPEPLASTVSLGHPYHGRLQDGIRLPEQSAHHRVQTSTKRRGWTFGTGYLVRGVLVSAQQISRIAPEGEPLIVGNLSKRGGGDIDMSMSHNTGRDVDFAYYTADAEGHSVESKYHKFGPDGRSRRAPKEYRLDIPRNWVAIKSFMASREFEVQYMIVAPYIEEMLLEHAVKIGEPSDIVFRAERMMMLPGFAKLHDNHIHMRVLCSPEDWERGCRNAGPVWPWALRMRTAMDEQRAKIVPDLGSRASQTRLTALAELEKRHITSATTDIAPLLSDADARVRHAARDALLALATEANAASMLKIARWTDATLAGPILEKALPLAGFQGLSAAKEIVAGTHPVLQSITRSKDKRQLKRAAGRLVRSYKGSALHKILESAAR